jgi:hypothetical protein
MVDIVEQKKKSIIILNKNNIQFYWKLLNFISGKIIVDKNIEYE